MGKTKTKIIDDSVPTEEVKKEEQKKPERKKILAINAEEESKPKREKVLSINQEKEAKVETSEEKEEIPAKKEVAPQQGQPKPRSKKYQEAAEKVEKNKNYPVDEAISLVKEVSFTKFPGSLEIHLNTSVKNLRGLVSLPHFSGQKMTILAFGKGAEDSGADLVGDDEAIKQIEKGKVNFDILITTPELMPRLARLAKVLGPRGLMPNPKSGTITTDLKKAVLEAQSGKTEYKTEKAASVIHLGLGKLNQPEEELVQNTKVLISAIGKSKIKKATLSPTMGPGIKLDLNSI